MNFQLWYELDRVSFRNTFFTFVNSAISKPIALSIEFTALLTPDFNMIGLIPSLWWMGLTQLLEYFQRLFFFQMFFVISGTIDREVVFL